MNGKSTLKFDRVLIQRMLRYLRPYRTQVIWAVLFLIFARVIEAIVPIYLGNMAQQIIDLEQMSQGVLYRGIGAIVALMILSYTLDAGNIFLKSRFSQDAIYELRREVYQHFQLMPISYYDRHRVGKMMTRTIHDIDQINAMFSESVIPLFGGVILFFSIVVAMFFVDWRVAIAICALFPAIGILANRFRIAQRICYQKIRQIVATMNGFVQEHLMGASTVRSFGLEKREEKQFAEINQDHCDAYIETIRHYAFFFAGIDYLQSLLLLTIFGVLYYTTPSFEAGTFFTFSLYVLMVFRPLYDLAERYNVLQSAMAAAERVFEVLDLPKETENLFKGIALEPIESIVFEDVWFAYEAEEWILKGISFEIKRGESIALVGITGGGKTTIMSLLLRFYDYQKGKILLNGKEIKEYSPHSLRQQISAVLQDPVIFSGTLRENLTLGDPNITEATLENAADEVNLREVLRRFPQGWNEPLKEHGKGLSVGEMQLISLARAVCHSHSLLVLDEATANIDSHTEQLIQAALKKVLHDKTSLVIAHRLSTIRDVDRILVIQEGKLVEQGTHTALLLAKGTYEKLYRLQF